MTHQAIARSGPADTHFDRLYQQYHQEVLAYCVRRMNRSDAEDVASEVFTVAWRRIDQVPTGERTLPWLYGVAHRVLANQWRSVRRYRRLLGKIGGLGVPQPDLPETVVLRGLDEQQLLDALARLRWRDQEVLRLATWEKLPHRGIAELLGCSEVAVGQRIARAKKRLARELKLLQQQGSAVPQLKRKEEANDSP